MSEVLYYTAIPENSTDEYEMVMSTDFERCADARDAAQSELAALREELAKFDEGMRALACSLGAGGYNAETLTADQLVGKVQLGIDHLLGVHEKRLTAAEQRNAELTRERDFWMAQFREMAQAQPFAMVDYVSGPHQRTPELDTYKWFWWNSTARPIYKGALCDVVLSDGSIHFNVPPDFNWNDHWDKPYVVAARHGPNLDFMEIVDRPASIVYPGVAQPTESGASE